MSTKTRTARQHERAAAVLRERRRRERRHRFLTVAGMVTVLLLVVTVGFLFTRATDASDDVTSAPAGSGSYGVAIGEPTAPHSVVIYEDFLCPYCGQLEEATRDDLARLAEEGAVHVEYRPYELLGNIGDYSARSTAAFAVVLEESGPAAAKRFHDLLFERQPSESGPFPPDEHLLALAVEAGAHEDEVRAGLGAGAGDAWVDQASRSAQTAGVRGTPTVLLDGSRFTDGRTVEELADNLVAELR
jgi:protein-disulfide isomerase